MFCSENLALERDVLTGTTLLQRQSSSWEKTAFSWRSSQQQADLDGHKSNEGWRGGHQEETGPTWGGCSEVSSSALLCQNCLFRWRTIFLVNREMGENGRNL